MTNADWSATSIEAAYAAYERIAEALSSRGESVRVHDDFTSWFEDHARPVIEGFQDISGPVFSCKGMSSVTFDLSCGGFRGAEGPKRARFFHVAPARRMFAEFDPARGTLEDIAYVSGVDAIHTLIAFFREPSIGADSCTSAVPAMAVVKRVLVPFFREESEVAPMPLEGSDGDAIAAPVGHFVDATEVARLLGLHAKCSETWLCAVESLYGGGVAHAGLLTETRRARGGLRDTEFVPRSDEASYVRVTNSSVDVLGCPFGDIALRFGTQGFLLGHY